MRTVMLVVVLAQTAVWAQAASPSVVPFPLEVTRPANLSDKQRDELQAAYKAVLRRSGALLPDSAKQAAALKELKRSDCDRDDECLAQLARLAGTLYAVFASVDLTVEGNVVAFGRVVRDDGKQVAEVGRTAQVKLPKGRDSFSSLVPIALTRLFEQLELSKLPLAKQVVEKPPEVTDVPKKDPEVKPDLPPPPPPPVVVVAEGPSGMKVAGWTMVGVGAAAVLGGVVMLAVADPQLDASRFIASRPAQDDVAAVAAYRTAKTQQTIGGVVAGVGGAVAVGGLVMVLMTGGDSARSVSVSPVAGGALVSFGGRIP